jgi:NitT/TauT family transport system substrate-binding protein
MSYGVAVPGANTVDVYIAEARGFFREQGLDVDISVTGPSSQNVQALVSGSVDVAGPATDAAILAAERGGDLVFVAGEFNRAVYALVVGKDVQTYADLRGQKLAVSDLRDGSTTLLRRMLTRNGVGVDDVDVMPLGGTPNRAAALTSGQVAGTMLIPPANFRLIAEGYRQLGLSTEVVQDYLFQAHASRRAWLRDHGDAAVRFLRAIVAADRFLNDPANREATITILADSTKAGREESELSYDLVIRDARAFPPNADLPLEAVQNVLTVMAENGSLTPPLPSAEKFVDLTYLEQAQR